MDAISGRNWFHPHRLLAESLGFNFVTKYPYMNSTRLLFWAKEGGPALRFRIADGESRIVPRI
jgi:hypothetical protein